jgi:low temperature requirement protein LtrA
MIKRKWWQTPRLRQDEELKKERSVTWLELFFDLIFVVVISRIAHNFSGHISLSNFLVFIFMFIPVFWVWNGNTYYTERFESDGLEFRIFTLSTIIPVAGMAVFSHHGLAENYPGFALSYLAARSINILLWLRTMFHVPQFRPTALRFILVFLIAAVMIVISMFLSTLPRLILWGLALIVDVISPAFTMKVQKELPKISTSKFPERFGLFTIIVLGEAVIGVISGLSNFEHLTLVLGVYGVLGLCIGFGLWWIYFDFIARRPPARNPTIVLIWVYLHIFLTLAIIMAGVLIAELLKGVFVRHSTSVPARWLCWAIGFNLVVMGATEFTLKKTGKESVHPLFSPFLKIGTGLILGCTISFFSPLPLAALLICIGALFIQILYGVIAWFSQPIDTEKPNTLEQQGTTEPTETIEEEISFGEDQ